MKLNGTHQILVYADDVNMLGVSIHTIRKNTKALAVNAEKTKYMVISRDQNARQNGNIQLGNRSFETVEQFKYLGTTLTKKNSIHEEVKCRLNEGMLVIILCRIFCLPVYYQKV